MTPVVDDRGGRGAERMQQFIHNLLSIFQLALDFVRYITWGQLERAGLFCSQCAFRGITWGLGKEFLFCLILFASDGHERLHVRLAWLSILVQESWAVLGAWGTVAMQHFTHFLFIT